MWEITAERLVATGEADVESSYSATETTIEITDNRSNCGPDPIGNYEWAIDDDVLTITLVSDECEARADALDGAELTREEPEPPAT